MLSLGRQDFSPVLCAMPARLVVLPNRPRPSHPRWLLSRQHRACVSPLVATLMNLPASVANKRLTAQLNLLDATLTKNTGGDTLSIPKLATPHSSLATAPSPFFSNPCALFCNHARINPFPFHRLRTLYQKPPGVGVLINPYLITSLRPLSRSRHQSPITSHQSLYHSTP